MKSTVPVPQMALLPCPFCGAPDPLELGNMWEENYRYECTDCKSWTGRWRTREGACDAWNKRAATWRIISTDPPKLTDFCEAARLKPYVLAVDAKGRMSVGYPYKYSTGETGWVFAKPIGDPTHWMPLPCAPSDPSGNVSDNAPGVST